MHRYLQSRRERVQWRGAPKHLDSDYRPLVVEFSQSQRVFHSRDILEHRMFGIAVAGKSMERLGGAFIDNGARLLFGSALGSIFSDLVTSESPRTWLRAFSARSSKVRLRPPVSLTRQQ